MVGLVYHCPACGCYDHRFDVGRNAQAEWWIAFCLRCTMLSKRHVSQSSFVPFSRDDVVDLMLTDANAVMCLVLARLALLYAGELPECVMSNRELKGWRPW